MDKVAPSRLRRAARIAVLALAGLALVPLVLTLLYTVVPPVSTLMLARSLTGTTVDRRWVPLSAVSEAVPRAVLTAEDARFCRHHGVDFGELFAVLDKADGRPPTRGASTLTMQVAKNLFLWNSRSYLRKALELPLALWIDLVLSKRRILEIYLNIAEWGEGIHGIEAAARRYFAKPASALTPREAALLAAALPLPLRRNPAKPAGRHRAIAAVVATRAASQSVDLSCL